MAKRVMQKMKLLYMMRIFLEETDETRHITVNELISRLAGAGINSERKSIYDDIECLKNFGLDICCEKGKHFGYYIASREFEMPELKLLVDAVQSSRFITVKKSMALIKKLGTLTSRSNAALLNRQVYVLDRVKSTNEKIYYNVDRIHEAIAQGRQIKFKYFEFNMYKEKVYRKDGNFYKETPVTLISNDDNYYLVTYKEKYGSFTHYRVDKMESVEITDEECIRLKKEFDPAEYTKKVFSMFGGEEVEVTVRFDKSLAGVVIDRFGKDVCIVPGDESFEAHLLVADSPQFLSWILGFSDRAKILKPEHLKEELTDILAKTTKIYEI